MPLSEDEQRILRQIEEQLQRDPKFGRQAKAKAMPAAGWLPRVGLSVALLAATILTIGVSPYVAFVCFVCCVVVSASAARRVVDGLAGGAADLADGLRSRFQSRPPEQRRS